MDIASIGIKVDSTQAATGAKDLDKLAESGAKAEKAADKLGSTAGKSFKTVADSAKQMADSLGGGASKIADMASKLPPMAGAAKLLALAVGTMVIAFDQAQREAKEYAKALILSGNAAGATRSQLAGMAAEISKSVGTQGQAASALATMAGSGRVAAQNLQQFAEVAIRLEREAGQPIKETVKAFSDLGNAPVEASRRLNGELNYLSAAIYSNIKALQDAGREDEAAALAQRTYADAMAERTKAIAENTGLIEKAWRGVQDAAKGAWDAILGVGRPKTIADQIKDAEATVEALRSQSGRRSINQPSRGAALQSAEGNLAGLEYDQMAEQNTAKFKGMFTSAQQGAIAAIAKIDEYSLRLGKTARKTKEINDLTKEFKKLFEGSPSDSRLAGVTLSDGKLSGGLYDKLLKDINDKYAGPKGPKAPSTRGVERAGLGLDIEKIQAQLRQEASIYQQSERMLEAVRSAGLIDEQEYYATKRQLIEDNTRAEEKALQDQIKRYQEGGGNERDRLLNLRKIAELEAQLAGVRSKAANEEQVITVNQKAAAERREKANKAALQAAQEYLDVVKRAYATDLAGMGQGDLSRQYQQGVNQITERYQSQIASLTASRTLATTTEQESQFDKQIELQRQFQQKSLDEYADYWKRRQEKLKDGSIGVSDAIKNYLDSANNMAAQMEQATTNAFRGMEDALVQFVSTGKMDFKSLVNSIIADMARITIRQQITKPLIGWIGSLLGGGYNTGGYGGSQWSDGQHDGGIIGADPPSFRRLVPSSVFASAKRYHDGLKPDEFPAILQKGEGVFTKNQMKAMGGGGVNITYNVHPVPGVSTADLRNAMEQTRELTKADIYQMQRSGRWPT